MGQKAVGQLEESKTQQAEKNPQQKWTQTQTEVVIRHDLLGNIAQGPRNCTFQLLIGAKLIPNVHSVR